MKKTIMAVFAAILMVLMTAIPAQAYTSGLCWVGGNQAARMSVTKWDSGYWIGSMHVQQTTYHIDLNPGGVNHASNMYIDGRSWGVTNDVYWNTGTSYSTRHEFKGRWWYWYYGGSKAYRYCTVIL